ncbi:2Fe-2S iron-sulfur cluster binding domain-containing protein [bacterium]|nr:2Fe-2S iron-sulfur cluster binding domain-containing protein [bacterium]MBU1991369.1 2Fe-2S iron-sulfur cluster binding domain-containing protein [bacterium]
MSVSLQDDNIRVKVPKGKTLRQVAATTGASMEFGCRVGDCITCVARVKSGMIYLSEKNEKELKALEILGGNVSQLRLMCQCYVRCEEGEIVISYAV